MAPLRSREGRVDVAEIARPHGIRGELKLRIYNADSDLLTRRRSRGRGPATYPPIELRLPDGSVRAAAISDARVVPGAALIVLEGVGDRDAAEALRGAVISVARDELPELEEGEFYACDLEGARALLPSGEEVGRVTGLQSYPTCDALLIDRGARGRIEVPLVAAYVASVDAAKGVVELVTVEGLD